MNESLHRLALSIEQSLAQRHQADIADLAQTVIPLCEALLRLANANGTAEMVVKAQLTNKIEAALGQIVAHVDSMNNALLTHLAQLHNISTPGPAHKNLN